MMSGISKAQIAGMSAASLLALTLFNLELFGRDITMENFDIDFGKREKKTGGALDMKVSSLCGKNGEKKAFVTFSDGKRLAEGEIPRCVIISNKGFSDEEVKKLEEYMKQNLPMLKSMAASINPIKALMK